MPDSDDDTNDDSLEKRDLSYREFKKLQKRSNASPWSIAGGDNTKCTLSTTAPALKATHINVPAYPSAPNLEKYADATWWYVPSLTSVGGSCPTVTIKRLGSSVDLQNNPVISNVNKSSPQPPTYNIGGSTPPLVNVDHVYEVKLLKGFFNRVIDTGELSCSDLNGFFMATDSANSGTSSQPRLQTIFNQLPSKKFADLVGMDSLLNDYKGKELGEGLGIGLSPRKYKRNSEKKKYTDMERLQHLNMVAASVYMVNIPEIAAIFKRTNQRMFEAFLGIDELAKKEKICGKSPPMLAGNEPGWANAYSKYMDDLMRSNNDAVSSKISSMANNNKGSDGKAYFDTTTLAGGGPHDLNNIGKGKLQPWYSKQVPILEQRCVRMCIWVASHRDCKLHGPDKLIRFFPRHRSVQERI